MDIPVFADLDDIKRFERTLDANQKNQLPFIWANTLNHVAFATQQDQRAEIADVFSDPKTASINNPRYIKTTKAKVKRGIPAVVRLEGPKKTPSWLIPHVTGAAEKPRKRRFIYPVLKARDPIALNKFGNISSLSTPLRNRKSFLLKSGYRLKKGEFLYVNGKDRRTKHLARGVYDKREGLDLIIAESKRPRRYKKIYDFTDVSKRSSRKNLGRCYRINVIKAFATMKNTK